LILEKLTEETIYVLPKRDHFWMSCGRRKIFSQS